MKSIKEFFGKRTRKIEFKKENIIPLVFAITITAIAFQDPNGRVMMFSGLIIFSLIFILFSIYAGISVMKALFFVGAEISLLIFIAQSYCNVDEVIRTSGGNDALKYIMVLGSMYILFKFFKELYKTFKENLADMPKKLVSWEKFVVYALYLFFTAFFVYALYLVVYPIVIDLCIYKI